MGIKISELPVSTQPYSGQEQIPLVQSGETRVGTLDTLLTFLSGSLLADSELSTLSGNWQNTYTTTNANSANWARTYFENVDDQLEKYVYYGNINADFTSLFGPDGVSWTRWFANFGSGTLSGSNYDNGLQIYVYPNEVKKIFYNGTSYSTINSIGGNQAVISQTPLDITLGGAWSAPPVFTIIPNRYVYVYGQPLVTNTGKWIDSFTFTGSNTTVGNFTTYIRFNDLFGVAGSFSPINMAGLIDLEAPTLATVGTSFSPATMNSLSSMTFPALATVGGSFSPSFMSALSSMTFPALATVGGSFNPGSFPNSLNVLRSMSFPALATVGGSFSPSFMSALSSMTFPALATVGASFSPTTLNALSSMSFPALATVGTSFSPATMNSLSSMTFPALATVGASFSPNLINALNSMSFPALATVGTAFSPNIMNALNSMTFPALSTVGSDFNPSTMAALSSMSFSSLTRVGSAYTPTDLRSLTDINFPVLRSIGTSFTPTRLSSLSAMSFPSLDTIGTTVSGIGLSALRTLSFPAMSSYGSNIQFLSSTAPNLSSVVLGIPGTLKVVNGNIILTNLRLDVTSVNSLMLLLSTLDGTNNTTTWGTGRVLTINGGTNAAPTGAGITARDALTARGATVTTN